MGVVAIPVTTGGEPRLGLGVQQTLEKLMRTPMMKAARTMPAQAANSTKQILHCN